MSDLPTGLPPSGTAAVRAQNGTSRPAQGYGPTPTDPPRYRTPTDVMRERRAREQRKAEQEAQRRQTEEEETRRRQGEETAGVEGDQGSRYQQPVQGYNIGGVSSQPAQQQGRRQETIAAAPQAQPRPSSSQQQTGFTPGHARISSNTQRNRTEAYDTLNIPATARAAGQQSQPSATNPSQEQKPQQQPRTAFPHAFERWENLSSEWEGLTSYWIRRLQENTNELNGKPIDQQMSRQITDLAAAGANLFHAVVELQRLRASSERKFQRWFFETRNEQEQAAERQAQLERELRAEREAHTQLRQNQVTGSTDAVRAEQARAEEMVREMRRELQISKEEARRAWEELGRREQEERERTIALRSGEPTLIGGVQVVPMQGLSSRQASTAQRPTTRDGQFAGGAGPTTLSGQQGLQPPSRSQTTTTSLDSPGEESRQFTFQPQTSSPTSTDPFVEAAPAHSLHHERDTQFYSASPPNVTQPPTSSAAMAAARAANLPPPQPPATNGASSRQFYQQPSPQTTIHQPLASTATQHRPTTATSASQRSYGHSSQSDIEEEYHINPDGSYTLDSRGQRIPYSQPLQPTVSDPAEEETYEEGEESEDYASDIARERAYLQQYSSPQRQQQTSQQASLQQSGNIPLVPTSIPPVTAAQSASLQSRPQPADYEGAGYGAEEENFGPGWEGVTPRHRHPTRLSDIIEEQTSRTSPSRTSYASGPDTAAYPAGDRWRSTVPMPDPRGDVERPVRRER